MSGIKIGSEWVNRCDGVDAIVKSVGSDCVGFTQAINGKKYFYNHAVEEFKEYYEPKEQGRKEGSQKPKHSHYHKSVSQYDTIDIYVICDLYVKDNSGCIQHAVKKLLCCGERGVKDNVKDLQEAIDTIQRKIEMLQGQGEAADD